MNARVDLGKIIFGAFMVPWWNRRAFLRALAVPLLVLVGGGLFFHFLADRMRDISVWLLWAANAVYILAFCLFAVTCHRLVLLEAPSRVTPQISKREWRFFVRFIGVWFMCAMPFFLIAMVFSIGGSASLFSLWVVQLIAQLPAFYMFGRLCPVFPATAVDRSVSLRWAWHLTSGNGWRLLVVVGVLPWMISYAVRLLNRANATIIETVGTTVLSAGLMTVEIAAISLAYRELTRDERAPDQA